MRRVVVELKNTIPVPDSAGPVIAGKPTVIKGIPDPVSVFSTPPGAVAVITSDRILMDYLTEEDAPEDAVYVGELNAVDGTVADVIGVKADFPHVFFGWDREALAQEPVGEVVDVSEVTGDVVKKTP